MSSTTSFCVCKPKPRTCAAALRKKCPRRANSASSRSPKAWFRSRTAWKPHWPSPDQTVETLREGVEVTLKQLAAAFERNLLKEIAPAQGDKFDPHLHQAISSIPNAQPANTVLQLLQKGYAIADRDLAPGAGGGVRGPRLIAALRAMTDPRFDPAQVFQVFGMRHVDTAGFDAAVVQAPGSDLRCVFLWGPGLLQLQSFQAGGVAAPRDVTGAGPDLVRGRRLRRRAPGPPLFPAWCPHFCAVPGRKAAWTHHRLARIAPIHGGNPAVAGPGCGKFRPGVLKNPASSPSYVGTRSFPLFS